jgi:hypothetical protein
MHLAYQLDVGNRIKKTSVLARETMRSWKEDIRDTSTSSFYHKIYFLIPEAFAFTTVQTLPVAQLFEKYEPSLDTVPQKPERFNNTEGFWWGTRWCSG